MGTGAGGLFNRGKDERRSRWRSAVADEVQVPDL
jgi:hypothetical protein